MKIKWKMKLLLITITILAISSGTYAGECKEYIELHSIDHVAHQTGWSKNYIVSSYKINLWKDTTPNGKGVVVGKLLPGSRALLIKKSTEDYLVKSPYDNSTGWISNIQVSRTLWQDDKEFTPCKP